MKLSIFPCIIIFYLFGCSNPGKTKKGAGDSVPTKSFSTNKGSTTLNKKHSDTVAIVSHTEIIGTWKECNYKEELTVNISPTRFTYKEHRESYHYKTDKDSIHLYLRETTISGKPYFIDDTLLIRSPDGDFKYVKATKQRSPM